MRVCVPSIRVAPHVDSGDDVAGVKCKTVLDRVEPFSDKRRRLSATPLAPRNMGKPSLPNGGMSAGAGLVSAAECVNAPT